MLAVLLLAGAATAESFDTFEFTVPGGWKRQDFPGGVALTLTTSRSFGSIVLYASVPAGSDARQNFAGEWRRLVTEGLGITGEPNLEEGPANGGYSNLAGGAITRHEGTDLLVLLSTFTGNGRVASVLYLTTDDGLLDTFDTFNAALKLSRPRAAAAPPPAQSPPAQAVKRVISTPTTRFDDGWVSTVENGFVRVAKGTTTVLLHDPLPLPESMWVTGNEEERVRHYWDRLVAPRYRVDEIKVFRNGICYTCLYFGEGSATELATGARKHVALYVTFGKGGGSAVQVVANDFASFQRDFPNIEAIGRMHGYNKFAVKKADLTGNWTEDYFGATQDYNAFTGAYLGMNAISSRDEFVFNADGTYSSKHLGASGYLGAQTFNQTEYKGNLTVVNDWQLRLSNRFKGETEAYDAHFEVVGGVPVLHLTRVGTSVRYSLVPAGR
ncbi:MAG TPA: hypothetical protein VNT60_10695 [Deinococcales bacterium]|nr:hypothetical protein [Deinococcales bacterium]